VTVPLDHPIDCPTGDGGRCALPNLPIAVATDGLHSLSPSDADALRQLALPVETLSVLDGMGVAAVERAVSAFTGDPNLGDSTALLLPCSCGHVLMARRPDAADGGRGRDD